MFYRKRIQETTDAPIVDKMRKLLTSIPEKEIYLRMEIETHRNTLLNSTPETTQGFRAKQTLETIIRDHITEIDEEWKMRVMRLLREADLAVLFLLATLRFFILFFTSGHWFFCGIIDRNGVGCFIRRW